jgi:hypothetical protein
MFYYFRPNPLISPYLMNSEELAQGAVAEWVQAAIRADREAAGLAAPEGGAEPKQGELNFAPEFNGL